MSRAPTGASDTSELPWRQTTGEGPAVVLVHGMMDRSSGMARVARALDGYAVTRYDRRGYARSAELGPPRSFADQVDDLVAVLEEMAPDGALVFGHSYGGTVALATAVARPDLVRGVVVYESPLPWFDWWPTDSAGARAARSADDPAGAAEAFMQRLVGPDRWARLPPSTKAARRAEGETMVAELAQVRAPHPAPFDAADVTVPVIAASGPHGAPHHHRSMDEVARATGGLRRIVDDAGHGVHLSHPKAVAALIDELDGWVRTGDRPA